jgi:hypothetical protein
LAHFLVLENRLSFNDGATIEARRRRLTKAKDAYENRNAVARIFRARGAFAKPDPDGQSFP